ncbi:MAG TPA: hypothetical protein VKM93_15000 [Terriglobia bacterium]|nr:hypothetical protein [Terriglobia bacterium]
MIFLIEYDRPTGTLVQFIKFEDSLRQAAAQARLDLELRLNREGVQHEVVTLEAPSEEAVRHSHGRYFKTIAELVEDWVASTGDNGR